MKTSIMVVVAVMFLVLTGCKKDQKAEVTPPPAAIVPSPQIYPQIHMPDSPFKAPMVVGGPDRKQLASDINGRKIPFQGEVWTFKTDYRLIEVIEVKNKGQDMIDVDVCLKMDVTKRSGILRQAKKEEKEFLVRVMYERSGDRWIARNIVGLQVKNP